MGKRLIIAEKPSVGRDIANVLNCRENGEGCRIGENDVVTWAVGHLVGLRYPDEMDAQYAEWKLSDLPIMPDPFELKVLDSGEKQFNIVKSWMNDPSIDRIVCATDAGREGELIFWYIYQMAGCNKPVDRLWISSLTYRAIKEGFENLKPDSEYDNLYESARCRSEADWLIGMNGSRAYSIVNEMKRLAIGRVLSPTLAILVKRTKERLAFVPEEYCEVIASFEGFDGRMICPENADTDEWSHFPATQKAALDAYVKTHSRKGEVVSFESVEGIQPPQQLYDLTSLQRDANRLYGMSSKWTLDTAQKLYERRKAITYPRTDSRFLSSDIESTLQKRLESLRYGDLKQYADQALESERNLFGRFINNKGVSDHHAIIPTGEAKDMESWDRDESQIYDLIARRFLGMFFPDRSVLHQKMETVVDGKRFISTGEKVIEAGWSTVDTSRSTRTTELPALDQGDSVNVERMRVRTDNTKPPAPHTEASLLAAMEHAGKIVSEDDFDVQETEFGIGTPATRAATIEKLIEKEMVVRKGKALIPTEYGVRLFDILPAVLQSPELTGEWEAKLAQINKGVYSPDVFMQEIHSLTKDVVNYAVGRGNTGINEARSVGRCPLCRNAVREYPDAYYCTNKNCGFRKIYKAVRGSHPTLHSITMRELLANGTAVTEKGTYKLIDTPPYISFEYAPKPVPDYNALYELIKEYGFKPINKVSSGGGFWIAGERHEEVMLDFVRDSKAIGCAFDYFADSRALRHGNGWCHRVDPQYKDAFEEIFNRKIVVLVENADAPDSVINLIEEYGFKYVDKRPMGGSLWIIAGREEGKALIEKCRGLGLRFEFTENGSRSTGKRPAWYSIKNR